MSRWVLVGVVLAFVGGCGSGSESAGELPSGDSPEELRERAGAMLERYDRALAQGVTVSPEPWDPYVGRPGLAVESAIATPAGDRLTVAFIGAPGPASEPCGIDYRAEAVEGVNALVVILVEKRHGVDELCPAIGATRSAEVVLARELGSRAVLDVREGLPVPVSTASAPD